MNDDVSRIIDTNFEKIKSWIEIRKEKLPQIFYSSVDLRESSFKSASIDTNIFPAGFNNLDKSNFEMLVDQCRDYINKNVSNCSSILLLCEDHTRNKFYLENVINLANIIQKSGFKITVASFLKEHPDICKNTGFIQLPTAFGQTIDIFCLSYIKNNLSLFNFDLCILNNDLSDGKYHDLLELNIPIFPHPKLGWHNRKKSKHIETLNNLTNQMINECNLKIDTWQLTTLFTTVDNVDINDEKDRELITAEANQLFQKIKAKYDQYNINEEPYLVIKSNNGTYGMGVISINSPDEILTLNRKKRNKLSTGKSSLPIESLIIQEGIPSVQQINEQTAEQVIYNINGTTVSGFYRSHTKKSNKDILNSTGMEFNSFESAPSKQTYILAQLANLSAQEELIEL